jgi:lipid A ethanolaminephosphotransferase
MLAGLQQFIDGQQGDLLIVLHQMGNHGPAYYKRYPPEFKAFAPVCGDSQLENCSTEEINNAYDNAILYTDYFLDQVIQLLKNNDRRFNTSLIYLSDHGESLGEGGLYLHGLPYLIAPDAQKHVAALMWFGQKAAQEIDTAALAQTAAGQFSHDNLFHTLLGLFKIHTSIYLEEKDILAEARS